MRIDLDHLRRYTGDDDELVAEVLEMFGDQTVMWLRALDPSADDATWSGAAHALKGSAQTVGATELGALCERAEAMVDGTDPARRAWIAGAIETEADLVRSDIQRWIYEAQMRRLRLGQPE